MKVLVIVFIIMFVTGCVQCGKCPIENVVIQSPYTGYPIVIEEGFFDDMEGIWTEREFKKEMEKQKKEMEKQSNRGPSI